MPPGQDSLVIIVDYKSATLRTNPSINTARKAWLPSLSLYLQLLTAFLTREGA